MAIAQTAPAVRVEAVRVSFGEHRVLDGVNLELPRGDALGLVGASGSGKSVLMRTILGFEAVESGSVEVLGMDPRSPDEHALERLRCSWGVAFQHGALFSSLTVAQNIQVPMRQLHLPGALMDELTALRLEMVGLDQETACKLPEALSGGMRKRVALARALALGPELLLLDEPTSGLDPVNASGIDDLISQLRRRLDLTLLMVTHDAQSLYATCDRVAALVDGRIAAVGPIDEVARNARDPWIREYFHGSRSRTRERGEGGSSLQSQPEEESGWR